MRHLWIFLILWLTFAINSQAAPTDATKIKPPAVSPQVKETVMVLHYANKMSRFDAKTYTKCPNQIVPSAIHFLIHDTTSVGRTQYDYGYFYFLCQETYWPKDTHYLQLKNNDWAPCDDGSNMQCTIKALRPQITQFILKIPPDGVQYGSRDAITFNDASLRMGLLANSYNDVKVTVTKGTAAASGAAGYYTYFYPGSAKPWSESNPTPTIAQGEHIILYWNITGYRFAGGKPFESSAFSIGNNKSGYYECSDLRSASTLRNFTILVNSSTWGKVCTLTCGGPWRLNENNYKYLNQDTWISNNAEVICHD